MPWGRTGRWLWQAGSGWCRLGAREAVLWVPGDGGGDPRTGGVPGGVPWWRWDGDASLAVPRAAGPSAGA